MIAIGSDGLDITFELFLQYHFWVLKIGVVLHKANGIVATSNRSNFSSRHPCHNLRTIEFDAGGFVVETRHKADQDCSLT